jgi:uncharacterized membrane-anchored protein
MNRIEALIRSAVAEGVLPADGTPYAQDTRPWPVVLLTALGAWLAVIPLIGVIGLALGDLISRSFGPYLIGLPLLAAALIVLRSKELPLFIEQLAVPALLVAGATLGIGLFRDLSSQGGALALALVTLGVAVVVERPWLRVLLGGALAVLIAMACTPRSWGWSGHQDYFWIAWHLVATITLAVAAAQTLVFSHRHAARFGGALESILAGMFVAVLAAMAAWSGMTFLVGATIGGAGSAAHGESSALFHGISAALAALGAAWVALNWLSVRRAWCAATSAVMVVLAWFMPSLGAVLLILSVCVVGKRWRIAGAAAVAAVWIIGAFYYRLDWSLATKALVLVAAGVSVAALVWTAARGQIVTSRSSATEPRAPSWRTPAGIVLSLVAVLVVANVGIWQKEQIIARGEPTLVELAPVDPRSLMQGDYMRLAFRLPPGIDAQATGLKWGKRPGVVARRDDRGVATVLRLDDGSPRVPGEFRIELAPKDGRWVLVTDAWFFKEGEAKRWEPARYGEFRVDSNGKALLVGLRDEQLKPL